MSETVNKNFQMQTSSFSSDVKGLNTTISQIQQDLSSDVNNISAAINEVKTDLSSDRALQLSRKGWYFNGVCFYKAIFAYRIYSSAQSDCISQGAHLASIHSAEEMAFVEQIVRVKFPGYADFWLGADDLSSEGIWKWLDGTPMNYLKWNSGEPNNGRIENCLEHLLGRGWNDRGCSTIRGYVCKNC